jgi:hypothetical protein
VICTNQEELGAPGHSINLLIGKTKGLVGKRSFLRKLHASVVCATLKVLAQACRPYINSVDILPWA